MNSREDATAKEHRQMNDTSNNMFSLDHNRRTILRAVGAGTALSLFAGVGAASESNTDTTTDGPWCSPCIDRLAGYTLLEGEEDRPADPDHVVDLYIEPRHVLFEEMATDDLDVEPGIETNGHEEMPGDFPDFFFDPVGLHIEPGDVVEFYNESEDLHTVTAFHPRFFGVQQRVPDTAHPFSSPPFMSEERWIYQFDEPGVYDLFCLPHFELGMVVRLVVLTEDCPPPAVAPLPEPDDIGFSPAVNAVFSAPELDPAYIMDAGHVAWDDLTIDERIDPATLFE